MIITDHYVPDELILRYCNIITQMEIGYTDSLEQARGCLHDEIFDAAGCDRSLYRKEDREFSTALNHVVIDMTEEPFQESSRGLLEEPCQRMISPMIPPTTPLQRGRNPPVGDTIGTDNNSVT